MNEFHQRIKTSGRLQRLPREQAKERLDAILCGVCLDDYVSLPGICTLYQLRRLVEWRLDVQKETDHVPLLMKFYERYGLENVYMDERLATVHNIAMRFGCPPRAAKLAAILCTWCDDAGYIYELILEPYLKGRSNDFAAEAFVSEAFVACTRVNRTWLDELKKM